MNGNSIKENRVVEDEQEKDAYLLSELERLEKVLIQAKTKKTYKVLVSYENTEFYVEELKLFYADRISKLIRLTRKS
ncbi:MAG: hypothetical protein QNK85_09300 [Crocinitomicaceae bacterium]